MHSICFTLSLEILCLQILGSESGWQPIPLTDVITASAIKKAYRKATLCVHPDKLQQRGATIQQKYICEKVFDLLKVRYCFASPMDHFDQVEHFSPRNENDYLYLLMILLR